MTDILETNTNGNTDTILSIPEDDTVNAWNDDNNNDHIDNILNPKKITQEKDQDQGSDADETADDSIDTRIHDDQIEDNSDDDDDNDDVDDSDDGFGDFNEADDDFEFQKQELEMQIPETINDYTHDYNSSLNDLFNSIISKTQTQPLSKLENSTNINEFELNERCENIYSRLIEDPMNVQFINWKKSIIRKQLYLTLNIPIDITELSTSSTDSAKKQQQQQDTTDIHNIYDASNLSIQSIHSYLIQSIPQFDKLNINDKEFNEIINTTTDKINEFNKSLQSISFFQKLDINMNHNQTLESNKLKTEIDKMIDIKSELLKISSCWDNKINISKKDNDIFSAYVSNLVENTQKLRRSNTAKKIKKRR